MSELSYAHGTSGTALLGDTIGANLDRAVRAWPDREALVDVPSGRRWTYARFGAEVDQLACALLAAGIAKGDRVGIWAVNCPEWVLVQYATARIGAIMVNINPAYRTHEVAYVLDQAGISLLFASLSHKTSDYRAMVEEVRGRCPQLRETVYIGDPSWDALLRRGTPDLYEDLHARGSELSCDDPINIQYTSGTTGFPKGPRSPTTTSSTTVISSVSRSPTPSRTGSASPCRSTTVSAWSWGIWPPLRTARAWSSPLRRSTRRRR